ncbi:MAG: hypothetical protein CL847_00485 [Crocinitomicaceae bacterium]|nr:hypothetical protein [Crocinitomicaceae bacterium]|tara:strand:+ start:1935 stop:2909 length:975 start_codon:yes stop_codon:yes gene_type:complete
MNRFFLLAAVILKAIVSLAQTIDAPFILSGDIFTITSTDTVAPGEAGENMVWDYTSLGFGQNFNGQFVTSSPSLFEDDYPHAEWIWEIAGGQYYYNFGPDMYEYFGGVENGASYPYTDSEQFYPYPFSYGDTHEDSTENVLFITGMETFRSIYSTAAFDGYGTINMPNETVYDDACRIRVHRTITDSTIAGVTQYVIDQVQFFQNGLVSPVVVHTDMIIGKGLGEMEINVLEYLQNYSDTSTEAVELDIFVLYPNPASNKVMLRWAHGAESIVAYAADGREVEKIKTFPGMTFTQFDVSDWPPGVYTISFTNGHEVASEQLIVE